MGTVVQQTLKDDDTCIIQALAACLFDKLYQLLVGHYFVNTLEFQQFKFVYNLAECSLQLALG